MKHIPILFSTPMVNAILDARKTMTRRVVKPQPHLQEDSSFINFAPSFGWCVKHQVEENPSKYEITSTFKCPYGKVGDVLWVKETFYAYGHWIEVEKNGKPSFEFVDETQVRNLQYHYQGSAPDTIQRKRIIGSCAWYKRPSIFMPKAAARIFLERGETRVERLQKITEADAISEGIDRIGTSKDYPFKLYADKDGSYSGLATALRSFESLWQSINGEQSWQANPWVWVVSFKRTEKPNDF